MKYSSIKLVLGVVVAVFVLVPATASAHAEDARITELKKKVESVESKVRSTISQIASTTPNPKVPEQAKNLVAQLRAQLEQKKAERQAEIEAKKAELKQKLDDAKKKACEKSQTQLNNTMGEMDKRRQTAFEKITQISESAQAFYTRKNLTIANYSDLLAAVNTTKAAATTSMAAQMTASRIDCNGDHPRLDLAEFKAKRSDSIDAMKAYRDAVKALVQAVKTAAKTGATN